MGACGYSMTQSIKLYFKYLFWQARVLFMQGGSQLSRVFLIGMSSQRMNYTALHFKLSTPFYSTHLCDMWAYEVPARTKPADVRSRSSRSVDVIIVYNFHTLLTQTRLHVFTLQASSQRSLAELFPAANWLEREVRELHGTEFTHKKDVRNLLLQYGDTSAPFRKSYPAIGLRELYYDPAYDGVLQQDLTVQI